MPSAPRKIRWHPTTLIPSREYTCAYCGNQIASDTGWLGYNPVAPSQVLASICICHRCERPTFFSPEDEQIPAPPFGNPVSDVNDASVKQIYEEARRAVSVNSFTAAVLCCRKLLMHLAVSEGAEEDQTFIKYVDYLVDNQVVPKNARSWVDLIRTVGNEANHDIKIMKPEDAKDLISFCEMLLKVVYEYPAVVQRRSAPPSLAE